MTDEEYGNLIKKLEGSSIKNPLGFRMKILLLALSSYAYIWLMVLLGAGLSITTIYLMISEEHINALAGKTAIITIIFVFTILKALWIKSSKPSGYLIDKHSAPELYSTVRDIAKKLKSPKVHAILLTPEYNAAMLQLPRLGPLGWYKNYLILGLPFMQTLPKDEFDSVIAHELGHLSKAHSKFSGWIYRVRVSWFQVIQRLYEKKSRGLFLFRKYFMWFIPKFDAYSFVLARQNEYVADSLSAQYSGRQVTGNALTRIHMASTMLEDFWSNHYRLANHEKDCIPPYQSIYTFVNEEARFDDLVLRRCQMVETDYADTHPALNERLKALHHEPFIPPTFKETAADFYFSDNQHQYVDYFDREWLTLYQDKWEEQYEKARELKAELEALNGKDQLTEEEALNRANLFYRLYGEEKGLTEFISLIDNYQEHKENPVLHYNIGKMLLEAHDGRGVAYIERTMELDWESRFNGLAILRYYYQIMDNTEKVAEIEERQTEWSEAFKASEQEIKELSADQALFPLEDQKEVEKIRDQLKMYGEIKTAYYVKLPLKTLPERQIRFLSIELNGNLKTKEAIQQFRNTIRDDIHYACDTYIFLLSLDGAFAHHITTVENSLIYDAETSLSNTAG